MSNIKKSLEENLEFIRSQLPDDLKDQAENCLTSAESEEPSAMSDKEAIEAICESLPEKIKSDFIKNPDLKKAAKEASLEEQKAAVLKELPAEMANLADGIEGELMGPSD